MISFDWKEIPWPKNLELGNESWIRSNYSFIHYKSKKPVGIKIGNNTGIDLSLLEIGENGELEIGNYCTFVQPIINTNKKIIIGDYCLAAYGVIIADSGFLIPPQENEVNGSENRISIKIGNNVWLGIKSTILEGADIGDNCIIGAGAIVNFKVPKNSIVIGNPGRIIEKR